MQILHSRILVDFIKKRLGFGMKCRRHVRRPCPFGSRPSRCCLNPNID